MAITPSRFQIVFDDTALMTMSERTVLYGLVFGLRPQRTVEIGTHKGGSARIIHAALSDIGAGTLVCIDPVPVIAPEHWEELKDRTTLLAGPSPDLLPQARELAGGPFDLALIDGDHEAPGLIRDIEGTLEVLADHAYLIFHDAHYMGVADGIDQMLDKHRDSLSDCGFVSVEETHEDRVVNGRKVVWGGLRLLRYQRPAAAR